MTPIGQAESDRGFLRWNWVEHVGRLWVRHFPPAVNLLGPITIGIQFTLALAQVSRFRGPGREPQHDANARGLEASLREQLVFRPFALASLEHADWRHEKLA